MGFEPCQGKRLLTLLSSPQILKVAVIRTIAILISLSACAVLISKAGFGVVDGKDSKPVQEETEESTGDLVHTEDSATMTDEAAPALPDYVPPSPSVAKIKLPVVWQMTRARFRSEAGASTHTESYREVWTFEIGRSGVNRLVSPRAAVPVHRSSPSTEQDGKKAFLPQKVVLLQSDFARLIGIPAMVEEAADSTEDPHTELMAGVPVLVTLHVGEQAKASDEMIFSISDVEHVAVQFEVGETIHY